MLTLSTERFKIHIVLNEDLNMTSYRIIRIYFKRDEAPAYELVDMSGRYGIRVGIFATRAAAEAAAH